MFDSLEKKLNGQIGQYRHALHALQHAATEDMAEIDRTFECSVSAHWIWRNGEEMIRKAAEARVAADYLARRKHFASDQEWEAEALDLALNSGLQPGRHGGAYELAERNAHLAIAAHCRDLARYGQRKAEYFASVKGA